MTSNLEQRLLSHNTFGKKGWTMNYRPWEVIYQENYSEKSAALKREKQLKSATGRDFIWTLIRE